MSGSERRYPVTDDVVWCDGCLNYHLPNQHDGRGYGADVPTGYQPCNVLTSTRPTVQMNHLVRWVDGGTPGPTACGLTRFDSAPGAGDADLPGWSMDGGIFGPNVRQVACPGCWEAAASCATPQDRTDGAK